MDIYQLLCRHFPHQDQASCICRGALLTHHGGMTYRQVFEEIIQIYRSHLISAHYHQAIASPIKIKLSPQLQLKLSHLQTLPGGEDIAAYARFILFFTRPVSLT